MSGIGVISLNAASRRQVWMNEIAFPQEAINTIGFFLRLPTVSPEELQACVNRVILKTTLFSLPLVIQENNIFHKPADHPQPPDLCVLESPLSERGLEFTWSDLSRQRMSGSLYRWTVHGVEEGGSVLFAMFHHVLLDGYSMCLLAQAVLDEIQGTDSGRVDFGYVPEPVGAVPKERLPEEERFWLETFEDAHLESALLSSTPSGYRRTWYHFPLGHELTGQIRQYARDHGLTDCDVFAGALSLYLTRASRTGDAAFLMPRLSRDTEQDRKAVGCFTMVVPVRVRGLEEMSFPEVCRHTHHMASQASLHKDLGMDRILSALRRSGTLTGPVSEYTLNFYQPKMTSHVPHRLQMSMDGAMHNHLTLNITAFDGDFEILYDGRDGVYDAPMVHRFHEALMSIICRGMRPESEHVRVSSYEIVGRGERENLLHMEGRNVPLSHSDTIPSLFEKAAGHFGDRPALYAGNKTLTFSDLDALSNRVANALLAEGAEAGEPVLFKLRRDWRLLPVMLGILKAGAAFVPIDPTYPQARIDSIQGSSGARMMIVTTETFSRDCAIKQLDADNLLMWSDRSSPDIFIPQNQLAYCIYTSGTTGTPKGVQLCHRGIVNITRPENNPFNRDVCLCGTGIVAIGSVSFDISLFEFFVPLLNGMFVELAPESALADPRAIARLLERHGANLIHCTPSRLAAYLLDEDFARALKGVEAILSAGEALPGALVDQLNRDFGIRVYNGYGPAECTIGTTVTEAGDNESIGHPIANTGVLILDPQGRLLPLGCLGEICVYGPGVGLGYRNLEEETRRRFVDLYGLHLYRTGDLGLFLPDGRVEYHGRDDFQVKIRGLRIELNEINSCMISMPQIAVACAQVRKIRGLEHLAVFYTLQKGAEISREEIREYLKAHLTLYMVPDLYVCLDSIPVTQGGKVDLNALAQIPIAYEVAYRAPENELQAYICDAFAAVLNLERVGLDDNFFEIGGNSLHTAQVVSAIEERVEGIHVEFSDLFRYPTPEQLAQILYRQQLDMRRKEASPLLNLSYGDIDHLLSHNLTSHEEKPHSLGNVLITGVSGYLGIHVLAELIRSDLRYEHVYCLVRPSKRLDPEHRFQSTLFYFENEDYSDLLGKTLFIVDGDITRPGIFQEPLKEKIDTVINCAADVSHFAYDDKLQRTNTDAVKNLLDFCEKEHATLVQVSTISVGGVYPIKSRKLTLTERDLFVGQQIHNQYILSKFMAEYEALNAMVTRSIPVKIMRVGNLQGRISDGEFQMNRRTNAFTRQISTYIRLGKVPRSLYLSKVNFSPVDEVARMILSLSALPENDTVFHVYPPDEVPWRTLFETASALGHPMEVMEDEEFAGFVQELGKNPDSRELLEGILVERPDLNYSWTEVNAALTEQALHHLGLRWRPMTDVYLQKYMEALNDLGMFEEGF